VKVALSVLALLVNVAFVVYIGYLLLRSQGGRMKDSHAKQARSGDNGAVVHVQRELEEAGLTGVVISKLSSKQKQTLRDMVEAMDRHSPRISFDMGTRVLVKEGDDPAYATVTASRSRYSRGYTHMVSVMDNKDPSGLVEVPCSCVQLLEAKEEDTPTHTHVAKQTVDNPAQCVYTHDSADEEPDATHTQHTHPTAADAYQSLVPLPLFARPSEPQ
jgi:hypothetical protein